jgi:thiamine-phosphate pyrophosphorylase
VRRPSSSRKTFPKRPLLCYVTDRRLLCATESSASTAAILQRIEAAAVAGVDWIQIREKDLSGKNCAALTRSAIQIVGAKSAPSSSDTAPPLSNILVNDRLDVALAENARGVHLGEQSLPVREAKRLSKMAGVASEGKGPFVVGVSCHSLDAAKAAASAGADYVFFGPVFSTPSKMSFGEPQGIQRLTEVCRDVEIPVLAIGGITLENAEECLSAGASGIAAIRLFQDTADVTRVVKTLRQLHF